MDFTSLSYLQGGIDLKEKVRRIFPDLNLDLLESDDEEAEESDSEDSAADDSEDSAEAPAKKSVKKPARATIEIHRVNVSE